MLRATQRGISLIEIAIGLAILGIVFAWAFPSYTVWMQNMQIRNMAESIVSGLQLARSEAINRDSAVQFVLTTGNPSVAIEDDLIPALGDSAGTNWLVRAVLPPAGGVPAYAYVSGSVGADGSANATVEAWNSALDSGLNALTFNGFGRLMVSNDDGFETIKKICIRSSALTVANGARIFEIDIGNAGQIKMCDPTVVDPTDTRRCTGPAPRCPA